MEKQTEQSRKKIILFNILKTAGILAVCTLIGYLFSVAKLRTENISMIYLVGVLLITVVTGALVYGIVASVVSVFAYNFFFTAPTMTFLVYDPNYIVTLIILLVGSFIVSVLTNKLHRHIADARRREKQMASLYEISTKFLNVSGMDNIVTHGLAGLLQMQPHKCIIYTGSDLERAASMEGAEDNTAAKWCFENVKPCGNGTEYFSHLTWLYIPLRSGNNVFGVTGIHCAQQALTADEMLMIRMVISQISEAMERETLYRKQEESKVKIEKEQLRNSLLRAISHDLRTPLTGIAGSADFISGSLGELSNEQLLSLVDGIGNDALWLNNMVENLLNMTRISDGELVLKRQAEVVDDIVSEAYGRAAKIKTDKNIRTHIPENVTEVPMDGRLIIQVLVNLLDNAIKYTPAQAEIDLSAYQENDYMVFEVSDNGGGIDLSILDKVFDNFVTAPAGAEDSKRGMGIGLSICKSIVEAHGGVIAASNNDYGGATFRFALPMK
ncbi:MAG: DUF4118 domain-containing protein [Christensenella sp.]